MFNPNKYNQSNYSGYSYGTGSNQTSAQPETYSGAPIQQSAYSQSSSVTAQSTSTAQMTGHSSLPPGWESSTDPQSGNEYYVHSRSGHTQWQKPSSLQAGWHHAIHKHGSQKGQLYYYNPNTRESRDASQRPEVMQLPATSGQYATQQYVAPQSGTIAAGTSGQSGFSVAGPSSSSYLQGSSGQQREVFFEVPSKRQGRISDCWYAAMQMVLSWQSGEKTKPQGDAVKSHRKLPVVGNRLSFDSDTGRRILEENGLRPMGSKLDLKDIGSIARILNTHGPFIVCGQFNDLGFGHDLVVCGVKPDQGLVAYIDPTYGGKAKWRKYDYFNLVHKYKGSDNPTEESVIVLK
ncbi:papain-like cysteine protease family protein [Erwinia sp. 9145]|uniref:papain-like cysteine protease family protein n=1 Tax=Erwinia sp. 9145 TaxID=1500895 RepID=UPI000AC67D8C|nr:papain-like cysteine protease family protein [Erwinia sp. 9145]